MLGIARRLQPAWFALAIFLTIRTGAPAGASTDFAAVVPRIAYALLPWTPFVPFVFLRPRRLTLVRAALMLAVIGGLVVEARFPIVARVAIAAALGATLDELAKEARPLTLLALCAGALAFLLVRDLSFDPARVLHARAVRIATGVTTGFLATALAVRPRYLPFSVAAGAIAGLFFR